MIWYKEAAAAIDSAMTIQAQAHQNELTKPPGSLGRLETVAIELAAMQGRVKPQLDKVHIAVFAGDHGVVAEGVSAFPQAVTVEMIKNFCAGGAAISVLARQMQASFEVVNCGTVMPSDDLTNLRRLPVAAGTQNFAVTEAMNIVELEAALAIGKIVIDDLQGQGIELFIGGEMGIGNTSSAAAIAAALSAQSGEVFAGPGTGISAEGVALKAQVIDRALALHHDNMADALSVLRCVGGFEIAALVGAYIRAAQQGICVLVDGFITTAAALIAVKLNPSVRPWLLFSHRSAEPAHRRMLESLQAEALLDLDLRLGEGSGAALAVSLLRSAVSLHNEMASFADAGVSKS